MIRRSQYRCSFKLMSSDMPLDDILDRCRQELSELISNGKLCNASFYRYKDMGFLYLEEIIENADEKNIDVDALMADLKPYLKPWPEEDGDRFSSSMVNAVLRKITLHKDDMQNAVLLDEGFKQILKQDYSKEQIALIEQMLLYEAPLDITPKEKPDLWAKQIGGTLFENGTIRINSKADISSLKGYEQGAWWVQDLAASLPVCLLGSIKGKKVLDLCAAPGGKTAQLLAKGAVVTALDISAERLETLKENINRLQLSENLTVLCADGFEYLESCKDLFDIILLDAPCSATGTFRKHPEVIHFKTLDDVRMQIPVQQKLLDAAATHITENGTILYCTCSIAKAEGEEQIKHFLKKHPDFCLSPLLFENLKICDGKILDKNIIDKQVLRTLPYNMKDFGGLDSFFAAALVYKK